MTRFLRRFDPWKVVGVAVAVIALIVGGVSELLGNSAETAASWTILAAGALGLVSALRASNLAVVIAAVLVAFEVNDPSPWGSWAVAAGLLFLYALSRPRFDAVSAGIVVAGTALIAAYVPLSSNGGGGGGAFGLVALAAAAVGVGQWVQAQRRYLVAEVGRRNQEAERRREEVARHVAEERLRIARELHDSVAHHLAVVSVHANVARANLVRSPAVAARALIDVQNATQSVLNELTVVLRVLRASEPEVEPTSAITADMVDDLLQSFRSIGLRICTDGLEHLLIVGPVVGTAARRLLQEALTNAHRYGDGTVSVHVDAPSMGFVTMTVRNKPGLDLPRAGSGLGLVGMRERVHLLGGRFDAGLDADTFLVTAQLPTTTGKQPV